MSENPPGLARLIDLQIEAQGPISVADYMALCLTHPSRGYYRREDPLGTAGDFVTAPEISQMFGELIGFFLVNLWQQMGEPENFVLLELGPGRGTLMQDILRVARRAEGFQAALRLRLYETNPALATQQRARLADHDPAWIEDFGALPELPLLIVANEFFDALPIHQFVRTAEGWRERLVGLRDGSRAFGLSPDSLPAAALPPAAAAATEGEVLEIGLAGARIMDSLARIVSRRGGAILAIDYGYPETRTGETLQAVRRHAFTDPLADPGEADLSAHVDFGALATVSRRAGLTVPPLISQRDFLLGLGIAERARSLAAANPGTAADIASALGRLTGEDQMGTLFKAFCATSPGLRPAGFAL